MIAVKKIQVVICEFHQEVLQYIHRNIAQKKLPFHNINMIHFDSHPDLAYPSNLSADDCEIKERMYNDLEIADWILPLMYMKHLTSLLWVKPPWANQIREGEFLFDVGKERGTNKLRVSLAEDYFLEDCTYSCKKYLTDISNIKFEVATLETLLNKGDKGDKQTQEINAKLNENNTSGNPVLERSPAKGRIIGNAGINCEYNTSSFKRECQDVPTENNVKRLKLENIVKYELPKIHEKYILDIDLDFFSVANPFLQDFTKEEYSILREIYDGMYSFPTNRSCEDELHEAVERSRKKLEELKFIVTEYAEGRVVKAELTRLLDMVKERRQGENIDWALVHEAGITTGLPHHRSSYEEIDHLMKFMECFLKTLPAPALITMARSSEDEYCPPDQVEVIQSKTLECLHTVYGNLDVIYDYKDESRLLE